MIKISIDVTRLDKSKFKTFKRKDGSTGVSADIILFENREGADQFGNLGFAKQDMTKEEREAKVQMPILGNWREVGQPRQQTQPNAQPAKNADPSQAADPLDGDDIPF